MSTSTMSVVAWVESPLQLVGAAEWVAAHGGRVPLAGGSPLRCRRQRMSSSNVARCSARVSRILVHPLESPRYTPPLAGGRRVLRPVPAGRPRSAPAPDHVPRRWIECDCIRRRTHGCRPYSRPGVVERGMTTRLVPFALEQVLGRALAGQVDFFTAFDFGDQRSAELADIGTRVERHRFEWTRRSARPFTPLTDGRVLLGSARPVDGRMPMAEYIEWVKARSLARSGHLLAASTRVRTPGRGGLRAPRRARLDAIASG